MKNNLQAKPNRGSLISFNESHRFIQDIDHGKITHEKALKGIANVRHDIKRINDLDQIDKNQVNMVNALFMVD